MSRGEVIWKLQALLERVHTRSTEPRRRLGEAKAAEPEPGEARAARPEVAAAPQPQLERPAASAAVEGAPSDGHDSRERLVAAEPVSNEGPAEAIAPVQDSIAPVQGSIAPVQDSMPPIDVAEIEVVENEEEPAPASSRRPVAPEPEERLAEIAFGSEEPPQPLHTPPPESGRLPAAPGASFEQDSDFIGVRSATPLLPRRMEAPSHELAPQAVRPELAQSDRVGEVIGQAQRFEPATFVALLDATLSL